MTLQEHKTDVLEEFEKHFDNSEGHYTTAIEIGKDVISKAIDATYDLAFRHGWKACGEKIIEEMKGLKK